MPNNLQQVMAEVQTFQPGISNGSTCSQGQLSAHTSNVGDCLQLDRKKRGADPVSLDCSHEQLQNSWRGSRQESSRLDRIIRLVNRLSPEEKQQLIEWLKQQGNCVCPEPEETDLLTGNPAGIETRINCGRLEQRDREDQNRFEYWFHWEVWKDGKRSCRSRYIASHDKKKLLNNRASAKIELVRAQIANDRPYGETLELLGASSRKPK